MSSNILNIILILAIISPMVYFMRPKKNTKQKALAEALKIMAQSSGGKMDKIGFWQGGSIGIDNKQGQIIFTNPLNSENVEVMDLKSASKCSVKKTYHNEKLHNQDISILKTVSLQVSLNNKTEKSIPVYDSNIFTQPGDDLLEAVEWEKIITNYIKRQ